MKLLALLVPMALLTGCPSFTTMGTARTIPEGNTQWYLQTGAVQLQGWTTDSAGMDEDFTLPAFEFGARHGITDDVEIGGKLWLLGVELNSKFQLYRSPVAGSGVDLALAPALSFYPFSTENDQGKNETAILSWVHLPLLVGVNTGPMGSQLVIGPRLSATVVSVEGNTGALLWGGGSLGYSVVVRRNFRFLPEISVMYPFAVASSVRSTTDLAFRGVIVQAGLGFVFGGY